MGTGTTLVKPQAVTIIKREDFVFMFVCKYLFKNCLISKIEGTLVFKKPYRNLFLRKL